MATIETYGTLAHTNITIGDTTRTLKEWAKHHDIPYATVRMRWSRGHRDPKRLFFRPEHRQDEAGTWVFINK